MPITKVKENKIKKTGRPTKMTPETVKKLEEAYLLHATDLQACFNAGITLPTLYDYQKKHPEFLLKKQALKGSLALKAKASLAKHIPHDGDLALKTLERIEKDTFSLRTEITGAEGNAISFSFMSQEEANRLNARRDAVDAEVTDISTT